MHLNALVVRKVSSKKGAVLAFGGVGLTWELFSANKAETTARETTEVLLSTEFYFL